MIYDGIIFGKGTSFEEKLKIREDAIQFLKEFIHKIEQGELPFDCEINLGIGTGIFELYCKEARCTLCPANKCSLYYNPESKLIQQYKRTWRNNESN